MALVLVIAVLFPQGIESQGLKYITVTASGTSYSYPQSAALYVTLNATGSDAAIATSNLSLTLSQFNYTVAKYIGGNSSRISTQSYYLQKVWNSSKYEAVEEVSISVPQIQNVSPLLGTLSLIQNVYIDQVSSMLTSQQVSQLTQSALGAAMQNATAQAQAVAGANSTIIVKNVTISRSYVYPFPTAAAAGSSQNPIFFNGREGVEEQVTVLFSYT